MEPLFSGDDAVCVWRGEEVGVACVTSLDSLSFFPSTPGYIFGKRIILFLFLMSLAGILNHYLILLFGSDFENYIKTITTTISPLLLIP